MKKKYYFLINSLEWWGAERVTINLSKNFLEAGKDVYIITLKPTKFYDLPKWVKYISLSTITNNLLMFLLIPWYVWKFKKVEKKYRLSEGMSLLEIANFVHILSKKDAVISFRTTLCAFRWFFGYIYKALIRWLYPKAKKIIVNSLENKYELADFLGVSERTIEVVYNPIDKESIQKLKKEKIEIDLQQKIKNKKVFVTTGGLKPLKNHKHIISALKSLYTTWFKDWIYLIIWDGPEESNLKKITKKLWLQKHIFFLWKQKNVFKYLAVSDIFLYASQAEGFPNVLLEARELWLPIITSDFKTWAKEVILGKYTKEIWKTISYPYKGKWWWLLDLNEYEEQFLEVISDIL